MLRDLRARLDPVVRQDLLEQQDPKAWYGKVHGQQVLPMLWMTQSLTMVHPISANLLTQVEQSIPLIQPIGMFSLQRVIQAHKAQVVQQDPPGLTVPQGLPDLLAPQEQRVLKAHPVQRDHQGLQEQQDLPVQQEMMGLMVQQERQALRDLPVRQEQQERLVQQVRQEIRGLLVQQDPLVSLVAHPSSMRLMYRPHRITTPEQVKSDSMTQLRAQQANYSWMIQTRMVATSNRF